MSKAKGRVKKRIRKLSGNKRLDKRLYFRFKKNSLGNGRTSIVKFTETFFRYLPKNLEKELNELAKLSTKKIIYVELFAKSSENSIPLCDVFNKEEMKKIRKQAHDEKKWEISENNGKIAITYIV